MPLHTMINQLTSLSEATTVIMIRTHTSSSWEEQLQLKFSTLHNVNMNQEISNMGFTLLKVLKNQKDKQVTEYTACIEINFTLSLVLYTCMLLTCII